MRDIGDSRTVYNWGGFIFVTGLLGAALTGLGAWLLLDGLLPVFIGRQLVLFAAAGLAAVTGLLYFGHPAGAAGIVDYVPHPLTGRDLGVFLLKVLLLVWLYLGLPWVTGWFTGGVEETIAGLNSLHLVGPWQALGAVGRIGTLAECLLFLALLPLIYLGFNALMFLLNAFEGEKTTAHKVLAVIVGVPLSLGLGLGGLGALVIASFANFLGALGFLLILIVFAAVTGGVVYLVTLPWRRS